MKIRPRLLLLLSFIALAVTAVFWAGKRPQGDEAEPVVGNDRSKEAAPLRKANSAGPASGSQVADASGSSGSVIQPPVGNLDVKVEQPPEPSSAPEPQTDLDSMAALLSQKLDLTDPKRRAQVVEKVRQMEVSQMEATRRKAEQMGIPLVIHEPGGTRIVLAGFDGDLPRYEADHNVNAAISSGASLVRSTAPFNVTGSGFKLGLWESGGIPRITHQEFISPTRMTIMDGSTTLSDHASHVAGTIIARGFSPAALGMAPAAVINAYDATNDNSEMLAAGAAAAGEGGKIYISNHSYGFISGWRPETATWYGTFTDDGNPANDVETRFGRYDSTSVALDGMLYNLPYFLSFMSSGNDRNDGPPAAGGTWYLSSGGAGRVYDAVQHPVGDGLYKAGYDVLDNEKTCKNVITIGAANDAVSAGVRSAASGTLASFSSVGPTDDGRIKPDVVANGVSLYSAISTSDSAYASYSGTSMAAPNASGSALLLMDYFQQRFPGQVMRASTLKGLIIHTANDIGRTGPDYEYGWGLMNVKAAADLIKAEADNPRMQQITERMLPQGGSDTHRFTWDGISPIRVTLCWTDPAGAASSTHDNRTRDLTNDLNLKLTAPGGTVYRPFVMPYVGDWTNAKLTAVATTGINSVDNVEQVLVSTSGQAGEYVVTVDHAGSLTFGPQGYSLIISGAVWPAELTLTPDEPFVSEGFNGGPFTPASKAYQLTNPTSGPLSWTASTSQPWVQVSPTSGTLAVGGNATVTVSWTASAAALPAGAHEAEVLFTDTVNDFEITRPVTLSVNGTAPQIVVKNAADQVLVNGGTAVALGSVPLGAAPLDALLKLGNSIPGTILEVEGMTLAGADAGSFALVSAPVGAEVASTDARPFLVRFSPRRSGLHSATLSITSNDPEDDPFTVPLTATATAATGPAQEIVVGSVAPRSSTGGPFQLPATATSGLPLTYTVLAGTASVDAAGVVTPSGIGEVTIQISQPGNGQYSAATPAFVTFVVTDQTFQFSRVSLSHSGYHTLAIGLDGRLWAWGFGTVGQLGNGNITTGYAPQTSGSSADWAEVKAGGNHSLGIKTNGSLWAWGMNTSGQVGDGTLIAKTSPVAVGSGVWVSIAAGASHSVAVKADGTLWAWGLNTDGQLGNGSTTTQPLPVQIGSATDWESVTAGSDHSLAVKKDGTLWAWGRGTSGQLGTGVSVSSSSPARVGADADWERVRAGANHNLAIKRNGTLWSWGFNGNGQLGDGTTTLRNTPAQIGAEAGWVEADAATNHSAALKLDGSAWAWGRNYEAQIGHGSQTSMELLPVRINRPGDDWRVIQAGTMGGAALQADGSLLAWGDGGGYHGKSVRQLTRAVESGAWTSTSGTNSHTLLTRSDGSLWGFGSSSTGQIGNNTSISQDFGQIGSGTTWLKVWAGWTHSGGIRQNGSLWMWGSNSAGQIGDGSIITRYSPLQISPGPWSELGLGGSHSAAIKTDGTLWTWGLNNSHQLGDGGTTNRITPGQVGSDTNWSRLAAGGNHTLALKTDRSLWATGLGTSGQLGLGDLTNRSTFTRVGTDSDWAQVAATSASSFGIKENGSLWAWGLNSSGQLGIGNTLTQTAPARVGTGFDWKQVACNATWTAAVKTDGTLWAWGNNSVYQQGVALDGSVTSPRQIGNTTGWVAVHAGNVNIVALRADGSVWTAGFTGGFRLTSSSGRSAWAQAPVLPGLQPQTILPLPVGFRSGRILSSSGLPVELSLVSGSGVISGDHFTATGTPGSTALVMAWQRGDETAWNAALPTQFSITTQAIDFPVIAEQTCGTPLVLEATASSGLPVGYTITAGADIASLQGNVVTFSAAGTVTLQAAQPGSSDYAAAEPVSRTFNVVKGTQTLAFGGSVSTLVPYISTVSLEASSSRGLTPVTFSIVSGPGELDGSQLSFTTAGVVVVKAAQAGNEAFLAGETTLEITGFNIAPVAGAVAFSGDEDVTITGTLQAEDAQNTPLTYAVAAGPGHGTLSLHPTTGAFSYTPAANYFGPDSFSFKASDGIADSDPATVSLTLNAVNDVPVALGQTGTTQDSIALILFLAGQDVDTADLEFSIVTPPAHGSLTGSLPVPTYMSTPGYSGPDSFTFVVHDGELTSTPATVSIQVSPVGITFVGHPQAQKVSETGSATFSVQVTGSDPITYQWLKDDEPLPNQSGPTLSLTGLEPSDSGLYQVEVTNPVETVLSEAAELRVIGSQPEIQVHPQHQLTLVGDEVILSVEALGKPPLSYQWRKDGKAIGDATQAELRLPAVQLAQAGAYTVVVTATESDTSDPAQVGVAENPGKTVLVAEGGKTSWSFKTAGKDLSLAWTQDGTDVSGNPDLVVSADGGKVSLTNAEEDDAGLYVCTITGPGGSVDGGTHELRVITGPPDITPLKSGDALPPTIVGADYEYEVPVSEDEHRLPASFTASGLPPGLKMDPLTGMISGRVAGSKDASYAVKITAKNLKGSETVNVTLFVNPFPAGGIGTFAAPLPRHAFNDGLGGRLDVVTTTSGGFSGKLTLGSRKAISFNGGLLSMTLEPGSRPTGTIILPELELVLVLDPETHLMEATLTDGGDPLVFEGWRSTWNTRDNPADASDGVYNLGLEFVAGGPDDEEDALPKGTGFAIATVAKAGSVKLAGKTADGEAVLGSTFLGPQGQILIFQTLYKTLPKGSLAGSLQVQPWNDAEDDADNLMDGNLTWSRPASTGRTYAGGFGPLTLGAVGQRYLQPTSPDIVLDLVDEPDNAWLRFTGAGVDLSAIHPDTAFQITSKHKVLLPKAGSEDNPAKVTLKLNAKTGQVSGTFLLVDDGPPGSPRPVQRKATYEGLIYTGTEGRKAYGYFMLPALPETAAQPATSTPVRSGLMLLEAP